MRTYLHIVYAVLSCVLLFVTPWTVVHQAPVHGDSPEYWSGLPCPPSGYLPKPVIEPKSPALQADSLPAELPGKSCIYFTQNDLHSFNKY